MQPFKTSSLSVSGAANINDGLTVTGSISGNSLTIVGNICAVSGSHTFDLSSLNTALTILQRNTTLTVDPVTISTIFNVDTFLTPTLLVSPFRTTALKVYSNAAIAVGGATGATGAYSFAQGVNSIATGDSSHTEGSSTHAAGPASHAEGQNTFAQFQASHAEGYGSRAIGGYSHAAGMFAVARFDNSWVWRGMSSPSFLASPISSTRTGQFMVSAEGGVFIPGNVGIGTDSINNALTIVGTISTNNHGTSEQWNYTRTLVQNNSASWEESADIIPTVTNYLSSNTTNVILNSATVVNTLSVGRMLYAGLTADVLAKYSEVIGGNNTFVINHNFNTSDVQVQVYRIDDGTLSYPTIETTSVNSVTIRFNQTIPSNSYRVVVHASRPSNLIPAYQATVYVVATGLDPMPALSGNWNTAYTLATAISATYTPEDLAIAYAIAL